MERGSERRSAENKAIRIVLAGAVQGVGFRQATRNEALSLGVEGWVRNEADGTVAVHAEGPPDSIESFLGFLKAGPPHARVESAVISDVPVEGHEQFAVRGISAGVFVVREHAASTHHFDLRLEVRGAMRSWALPKGPSMDPAVKRLAVQTADHELGGGCFEGPTAGGAVAIWDHGIYEQGGRVSWPEALERGHAVFVLHGQKLQGGFALQRTGSAGKAQQWLLIKRRDELARPGSDVVAELPASVLSARTLEEIRDGDG